MRRVAHNPSMSDKREFLIESPPPHEPHPALVRWLLWSFAVFCLVMGVIGIIVPGLPTTVFILMAGWAAARSSPRLHYWLWNHRLFGPMLRDWSRGGWVSRRAKWSATIVMALCAGILLMSTGAPLWVRIGANACMAGVLFWLWLRPEPPLIEEISQE